MMLSLFRRDQNQYNVDLSSPNKTITQLSSTSDVSPIHNSTDFDHFHIDDALISSPSPSMIVEPEDLSLRSKRQDDDQVGENSSTRRCHVCDELLLEDYLAKHLQEKHAITTNLNDPTNTMISSISKNTSPHDMTCNNGQSSSRSILTDQSIDFTWIRCPLCNMQTANESEFMEHYFRHHGNEELTNQMLGRGRIDNGSPNQGQAANSSPNDHNGEKMLDEVVVCELCNKEFCNKTFLEVHKANIHGILKPNSDDHLTFQTGLYPNGRAHSGTQSPKTPSSTVFDPMSAVTNSMSTLPFSSTIDPQQQLAALNQQNICPFCHQFFPNSIILQSHLLTAHSGLLMNPAAAMYAGIMTSPFGSFLPPTLMNGKAMTNGQQQMAAMAAMLGFGAAPTGISGDAMSALGANMDFFNNMQNPAMESQTSIPMNNSKVFRSQSDSVATNSASNGSIQRTPTKNMEAYCELCQKVFCNKYFLRTHKLNKHNIMTEESPKSNVNGLSNTKTPIFNPPSLNFNPESNKDSTIVEILRKVYNHNDEPEDNGPPSKMPKLDDSIDASINAQATCTGQFPCNLCVKTFPSMFTLVAHKYRDHGTFDGATSSNLDAQSGQSTTSPILTASPSSMQNFNLQRLQQRKSQDNESSPTKTQNNVDLEAYCEICQKEFCSKYFLKVHKANIHGINVDSTGASPSMVVLNNQATSSVDQHFMNGSILSGILNSNSPINTKQEKENGRRHSSNGSTPTASAILMMAAANANGGIGHNISVGRQLSKNFCDICNKELCNKYFLRTHMLKMHGIVIDENKTVIANINTLDKEKSGELMFRCDLCGEQLASRHQLRAHKQNIHQITVPPSSTSTLSLHQSPTTSSEKSENGNSQDYSTPNLVKAEFINEFLDQNGNDDSAAECEQGMDLSQPTKKTSVYGGMENTKSVLCTVCGKRFKNSRCLRMHILNDHMQLAQDDTKSNATNNPICEYCFMHFPDHTELQLHVIHQHQREVRGSVACMAEQAALDALSNTSAFVAAVNSVVNAVAEANAAKDTTKSTSFGQAKDNGPESAPTTPSQENGHLPLVTRAKNGTKLFRCSYCNYYTRWISNLSTHEKRHNIVKPNDGQNDEKPFKCRMCLRSYRYSHSLQRHMEVHRSSGLRNGHRLASVPITQVTNYSMNDHGSKTPPALNLDTKDITSSTQNAVSADIQSDNGDYGSILKVTPEKKPASLTGSPERRQHCQQCDKYLGNAELFRLHMLTMHNTTVSGDMISSYANGIDASPTKRVYRCRMCHFTTTKSYDDLRMHIIQKHNTSVMHQSPTKKMQFAAISSLANGPGENGRPVLDSGHSSLDQGHASLDQGHPILDQGHPISDQPNPPLESNEHDPHGIQEPRYIIQPFLMNEKSDTGCFANANVVYLPVLRRIEGPIEAHFTLTPIDHDETMKHGTM